MIRVDRKIDQFKTQVAINQRPRIERGHRRRRPRSRF
jgi:hypothetical protein